MVSFLSQCLGYIGLLAGLLCFVPFCVGWALVFRGEIGLWEAYGLILVLPPVLSFGGWALYGALVQKNNTPPVNP